MEGVFGEDNRETILGEVVEEKLCYSGSHCSFGGDLLNLQRRDLCVTSCLRVGCGGLLYLVESIGNVLNASRLLH